MRPRLHRHWARINSSISHIIAPLAPEWAKHLAAMAFWHRRFADENGKLKLAHYEPFYTKFFSLD